MTYTLSDDAAANETFDFSIQAVDAITQKVRTVTGGIFVIPAEVFEVGVVGPEGGTLLERDNGIEIVVPAGAVAFETTFTVLKGKNADGDVTLEFRSSSEVQDIEIFLPDPELLNEVIETTSAIQPKGNEAKFILRSVESSDTDDYPVSFWRSESSWFSSSGERIKRRIDFFLNNAVASSASALTCAEEIDSTSVVKKTPVLFIHGYKARNNKGGGPDTWGDFPARVGELISDPEGFLPCEFRWKTNASFRVVAEDLRKAIELLVQKTEKEAHIIAHSFGGVLARTYLQGLAFSPFDDYPRLVASLTTLGTPHSGIAGSDNTEMYKIIFPDGQDGNLLFNSAGQISVYQTGEFVRISDGMKRAAGLEYRNKSGKLVLEDQGFIAAAISAPIESGVFEQVYNFPEELPIQALIGINANNINCASLEVVCPFVAQNGDGLITYSGQRFHPSFTLGNTPDDLLTFDFSRESLGPPNFLKARISEYILGVEGHQYMGEIAFKPARGFAHNSIFRAPGHNLEAFLECESVIDNDSKATNCDFHDGFRRVREWLELEATGSNVIQTVYSDPEDTTTDSINLAIGPVNVGSSVRRVLATVVTQEGVPIERLIAGNFTVVETRDGEDIPLTINSVSLEASQGNAVVIAIDRSGSMGPSFNNDIVAAREAALVFVDNMSDSDQAAIVDFAGEVVVRQVFTRDKQVLRNAIAAVDVGVWNGTSAYDAAYEGLDLARNVFGRKAVILLTDGEDLTSSRSIEDVTDYATLLGIPIYTVGLGVATGSIEEEALIQIADGSNAGQSGSGYYMAPTASDLESLYSSISDLLSNAYEITWNPTKISIGLTFVEVTVEYQSARGDLTDTANTAYQVE